MSLLPTYTTATVEDVTVLEGNGPWDTKSGGQLNALFGIPYEDLQTKYFNYQNDEIGPLPSDIRGLRAYMVKGLKKGKVGANEWHRIRSELVFATKGSFRWSCEDLYGNKKEFILENGKGVWTPPYVIHTYEGLSEENEILVIANTLFIPDDPETHDTYSSESFQELQAEHAQMRS